MAYRECERITRVRARNFSYGIRLLPPAKRAALSAVYALARRIDDIGDGSLPEERKLALLGDMRSSVLSIGPTQRLGEDPVMAAVADAASRFALPLEAFSDLVDGVEMDVRGVSYQTFEDLLVYCRRVAGSIGRLSVAVFGVASVDRGRAPMLADDLGVAMQLVNVLRDVREDWALGRTYLPAEDLRRFDCDAGALSATPHAAVRLVRFEVARARRWFDRGLGLVPLLDSRSAACVSAMAGIYRRILERLAKRPEEILRGRVALSRWEKAWVAATSLAGMGR